MSLSSTSVTARTVSTAGLRHSTLASMTRPAKDRSRSSPPPAAGATPAAWTSTGWSDGTTDHGFLDDVHTVLLRILRLDVITLAAKAVRVDRSELAVGDRSNLRAAPPPQHLTPRAQRLDRVAVLGLLGQTSRRRPVQSRCSFVTVWRDACCVPANQRHRLGVLGMVVRSTGFQDPSPTRRPRRHVDRGGHVDALTHLQTVCR